MLSYGLPVIYTAAVIDTRERTASRASTQPFRRLRESLARSTDSSEFLTRMQAFNELTQALSDLSFTEQDWNSYGSPKPSVDAIRYAGEILNTLRRHNLPPARILPSAEGGVALVFTSSTPNRAVIEALNDGETFLLLYNRAGVSKTLDWPGSDRSQEETLRRLKLHIRGANLAAS